MKTYAVLIHATVTVKAKNEDAAIDKAMKKIIKIDSDPLVTDVFEVTE